MKALGPYEFIDGGTIGGTHQNTKIISVINQRANILMWVRVGHHFITKFNNLRDIAMQYKVVEKIRKLTGSLIWR
jgi:hypothetical protein